MFYFFKLLDKMEFNSLLISSQPVNTYAIYLLTDVHMCIHCTVCTTSSAQNVSAKILQHPDEAAEATVFVLFPY